MSEAPSALCTKCARPVPPDVHYCPNCQAPLTAHAVCDPFDTILTSGYMYREASQRPKKPIVVAGIALLFGPMFATCSAGLLGWLFNLAYHPRRFAPGDLFMLALLGLGAYISGSIFLRSFGNYRSLAAAQAAVNQVDSDDEDEEETEAWWDETERDSATEPDDGTDAGPSRDEHS